MIKILYFANIKEILSLAQEELALDENVSTVKQVLELLVARGERWRQALDGQNVLVAINQEMADIHAVVSDGDEVAFFPPVTGG
jgi:molybdopterin synthase sulfur carrier subunit